MRQTHSFTLASSAMSISLNVYEASAAASSPTFSLSARSLSTSTVIENDRPVGERAKLTDPSQRVQSARRLEPPEGTNSMHPFTRYRKPSLTSRKHCQRVQSELKGVEKDKIEAHAIGLPSTRSWVDSVWRMCCGKRWQTACRHP